MNHHSGKICAIIYYQPFKLMCLYTKLIEGRKEYKTIKKYINNIRQ